jgi:dihydrofolate reductase
MVTIVAAMAKRDRGIGFRGALPWRLPADMAFFRATTMGHAVLMGRKTYESLPGGDLEGRELIVLSRRGRLLQGVTAASTLSDGLECVGMGSKREQVFIAGGGEIYAEALRQEVVDRMLLTVVNGECEADVFFPEFDESRWQRDEVARVQSDEFNSHAFVIWEYLKNEAG